MNIFEKILERLEDFKHLEDDSGRPIHTFSEVQRISKCKEIVQEVAKEYNITNGDKIRYMNDEELAEFLVNFKNTYGDEYEGEMSCLDWLKSEAEN